VTGDEAQKRGNSVTKHHQKNELPGVCGKKTAISIENLKVAI
jgi:hypothetical protein